MDVKELRIGNLIHFKDLNDRDSGFIKVSGVSNHFIDYGLDDQIRPTGVKPIPLTEWWLLKLGLIKTIDSQLALMINESELYLQYDNGECFLSCDIGSVEDCKENVIRGCKYVHQLQNLYFSLTGKELCQ